MPRPLILILIAILALLPGCESASSRHADSTLAVAEKVMDEHPDSALTLLSDSSFHPEGSHRLALHALLLTQARHKCYIDETNDSLIATAVSYFDSHSDPARLMKSLFYQATINSNAQNYPQAMTLAMRADKIAKETNDIYWQARLTELMGHIFAETYFYEEAVKFYGISASLFKQVGIDNEYLYILGDIATNYINLRDYDKAIVFADSMKKQISTPDLTYYNAYIYSTALSKLNRFHEAEPYSNILLGYSNITNLSSLCYSTIANIKIGTGNISEAIIMLDKARQLSALPNDSLSHDMVLLRLYEKTNNIPKIYSTLDSLLISQNAIAEKIRKQSSVLAQRDFYSQQAADAELKAAKHRHFIIVATIVTIFIAIILIILFRHKLQRKNSEIQLKVAQIRYLTSESEDNKSKLSSLSNSIDTHNQTIKELTDKLDNSNQKQDSLTLLSQTLLRKHFDQINTLIDEYYEDDGTNASRKAIYKNIEFEIKKLTDKKNISEIEDLVNSCSDGIITKMRLQLTDFSNDDITFLTLTIAGYGAKAISIFTGLKPNSTYSKRSRLIARIKASNIPDKELFIAKIAQSKT